MLIHWWIRQNVSNMKRRALSMKSSRQATRKKSLVNTWQTNHTRDTDQFQQCICRTKQVRLSTTENFTRKFIIYALTVSHSSSFFCAPSKSKLTYKHSRNSVIGSRYVYDSYKMYICVTLNTASVRKTNWKPRRKFYNTIIVLLLPAEWLSLDL